MSKQKDNSIEDDVNFTLPSKGVQSLITFLLIIHLFAVFVAIASNSSSASIYQRLRNQVPGILPYLQATSMDQAYTITHHESPPVYIEAILSFDDKPNETIRFPEEGMGTGHRFLRMRRYCQEFADRVREEDSDQNDILTSALGGYLKNEYGAKGVRLVCYQQILVDEESFELPEELRQFEPIYTGEYVEFRGTAQVLKLSPNAENAKVIEREDTP